jgi:rhodanese-related sulfurtransferase
MARPMRANEIREILADPESTQKNAFELLRAIADYVNNPDTEAQGHDLVIRALEHRLKLEPFAEILNGLVREIGLFPYLQNEDLCLRDAIAFEYHKPDHESEFVFHRIQAEVYRRLMNGDNIILSAPTSFGKSRIVDAIVRSNKFSNIAIVVPTIALIDETRRRIGALANQYKIISQLSQKTAERNLFIFTAERINAYSDLPSIEFFVIDEFYKIGALGIDTSERTVALNQAFYKLFKDGGQFYLLGPCIRAIPEGLEKTLRCSFISTDYSTVATDITSIYDWESDINALIELCKTLDEPTLIYCRSPRRVNEVASALLDARIGTTTEEMKDASDWISEHYHNDWIFGNALKQGIGLHHGRLPRSLAQLSVRSFNERKLNFLICTSTLIEGVNTRAKNVVVFDHKISNQKFDFFTFNNIKGRSGRMLRHFVGKVFLFRPPPQEELPFVDFPLVTQNNKVPNSLLIQIDSDDLTGASKERLDSIYQQDALSLDIIRLNSTIEPLSQISLAREISQMNQIDKSKLLWNSIPSYDELRFVVDLIWSHFKPRTGDGVYSASQLTLKIWRLKQNPDVRFRIHAELEPGTYQAISADEAVERVLGFDRNWAGHEFPKLLMALDRIQEFILMSQLGECGSYSFFGSRVEQLFRDPALVALEEYGLPIQIGEKLNRYIDFSADLDSVMSQVKIASLANLELSAFEYELLRDIQQKIY